RLQRDRRPAHLRRQRLPADAVALRALRPEPDVRPALRLAAHRPAYRRPGRHHRGRRHRLPVPRADPGQLPRGGAARAQRLPASGAAQRHALQGDGGAAVLAAVGGALRPPLPAPARRQPGRGGSAVMYRHGAHRQDGRTRYALWAPDCREVMLETQDGALHEMQADEEGWFRTELEGPAGDYYRYLIDCRLRVPVAAL